MDLAIYEWLSPEQYASRICPHMERLLSELLKQGNAVRKVGLQNYKAPEAVVILSKPLSEPIAAGVAASNPSLHLHHNGIGELHSVTCVEHYISVRCTGE